MRPRPGQARRRKDTRPGRRLLATAIVTVTAGSLTTVATPAAADTTWLRVSAGSGHTCGITSANDLYCWGYNYYGQLGTGDTTDRLVPTRIGGSGKWTDVSAGSYHTCALDTTGRRYCWGNNASGQLGHGHTLQRLQPTSSDTGWIAISAGKYHTCGIKASGKLYCWGDDFYGQLGNSQTLDHILSSPQEVAGEGSWARISAHSEATCATNTGGQRYCWGYNAGSSLGLGINDVAVPLPTTWGNGTWRTLATGYLAGCGVSQGRHLYCWGSNTHGQLGVGDTQDRPEPTDVMGGNWARVTRGIYHTCGFKTDGTGYCWGDNYYGQLGSGPSGLLPNSTVPRVIGRLNDVVHSGPQTWSWLAAGSFHACGISTEGALYCWGANLSGQVGDGTTTNRPFPRKVTEP